MSTKDPPDSLDCRDHVEELDVANTETIEDTFELGDLWDDCSRLVPGDLVLPDACTLGEFILAHSSDASTDDEGLADVSGEFRHRQVWQLD